MRACLILLALLLALPGGPSRRVLAQSDAAAGARIPDDSPASRDAARARLRAEPAIDVCADASKMSRTYGTTCASREFPGPPILDVPKVAWETKPGWWGAWSPFLAGDLVLTGSCNNDGGEGISALDMKTGQTRWRISDVCRVGARRGSMGNVSFFELPSGEVLLIYPRSNGEPADYYVIDPRAGRIVRSLSPLRRGPTYEAGGVFTVVTQSAEAGRSYINAFGPDMAQLLWRNDGFRLAMTDTLDPHYRPTFSAPAAAGGIMYRSARSQDQPDPPTRQLHAIDIQSGRTLWRHTDQPRTERTGSTAYRSDDENPMVAGGQVIIKVYGMLGVVGPGTPPNGEALRALDARTGEARWTTPAVAGQAIVNRVAARDVLVAEVVQRGERQLRGYRLDDGTLAWQRPVSKDARLLASSGGAFYVSERVGKEDFRFQGLDGATGTLLWTTVLPGHNLVFDAQWGIQDAQGGTTQGPAWRIGRDGAIYGVTLTGAYKLSQ